MTLMRILESVHGHFGILFVIALVHPAILLRRGQPMSRGVKWSVSLTTLLALIAFGMGVGIYESYRATVKRELLFHRPEAAIVFEAKEHLAFVVLALALGAGIAAWIAPADGVQIRRTASRVYAAAAILCFIVAAIGTSVAAVRGF